ncbi:FecR domain-containing protein [Agrobacterium sp. T29]|uniref:FecR family protein n=1 Tax=Agrobacterium sp. T29 TaxID=2580515 RepID=UPI00143D392A|nr:FecR domain-containing protein [Agrobacterium sp. T29]
MTDPENCPRRDKALIEKEAVAWFTRMNGKPTRSERRDFAAWLDATEDHRQSYGRISAIWSTLGSDTAQQDTRIQFALSAALDRIEDHRRKRKLSGVASSVIGCLALFAAGFWLWLEQPHLLQNMQADFISDRRERRDIMLSDGSKIFMDADTALKVSISANERRIHLLRGNAYFEVAHSTVPFKVKARSGEATVLGTEFEIATKNDSEVTVTLAKGSIAVWVERGDNVILKPGESVDYGLNGLSKPHAVDLEEVLAWRNGRLIFTNARLGDVLAEIGRYREGRLVVLGQSLAEHRVSGNIALDDPEKALAAMQSSVGFNMTVLGSRLAVIRQ